MIKASIIIAAYNIEEYIEKCMMSAINQTEKEIEIIVVNDGSTDKTLDKINKKINGDSRIVLINQVNKGLIEARKSGLKVAKGEFILFIDGDDWIEEDTIEKLYNTALKNKSDIVLYSGFWATEDSKTYLKAFNPNMKDIGIDPIKDLFLAHITPGIVFKFIRRNYIEVNNIEFPKNIGFAEDLATSASLFMYKPKISTLNKGLYNYYQRTDSISKVVSNKILEVDDAISFIESQLKNNGLYDKYIEEFELMVYIHLFMGRFMSNEKMEEVHKKVYMQYKARNIKMHKNKYINSRLSTYSKSLKIRIKAYNINYYIGCLYDVMRYVFKGLRNA